MVISTLWFQVAIVTFAVGFGVLAYLAYRIYTVCPPIPARATGPDGRVLFTAEDVITGQQVFQKYGLMQFGTIFGHGAYLGPDFTAQYLHRAAQAMADFYAHGGETSPEVWDRVQRESKHNAYDAKSDTLVLTDGQAHAFDRLVGFYTEYFGTRGERKGIRPPEIREAGDVRQLTAYFAWAAWAATTARPGETYSYSNNWPPDSLLGNVLTADAFLWSALSLIGLLGGAGLVLFAVGRYDWLGWQRPDRDDGQPRLEFRPPEQVRLTPAQRATVWYFLVVAGLFLAQGLLGGVNAHYHAEPGGFYGLGIDRWLPYNLSRTWHVQLALFFVATSFLAMGIFVAPMIAGREPRHQDKLAIGLFGALVLVVVGSLIGEAASIFGYMPRGLWFWWIGDQGWEYLDLGRLWQILLVIGMALWVAILLRGMWPRLRGEHFGNLPYLFIYSALSIPLFYAAGLAFGSRSNFTVMDFWRFWVVHLWVEDFLELFTTIMVAYVFVLLGVVRTATATRIVYLDIILYSIGGVIGTMHHAYFSGASAAYLSLGAFFSAMEVIPLLLLTFEAWRFMRLAGRDPTSTVLDTSTHVFPHKWAVMFLVAVGFWNFLGAGVFGFLINLPVISYYEIGTQFTANHGHGAMMGVYGMLAIGFFMFVARYFLPADGKTEAAMRASFWCLNIGLGWMVFVNLAPVGAIQFYHAVGHGYWAAREPEFFQQPAVRALEWLRLPGDAVFIFGGILPVVYLALRMIAHRNRPGEAASEEGPQPPTQPSSAQ
ncbi:MAG: cbb3-type cytochrome c oxidase subunit I [Planctomycetaceae bacterium]|nr:cbb3-type cytochrome c oxidase subunit I [Planctomycetaceae bacterium]